MNFDQQIEQIIVDYGIKNNPGLKPISKFDSDKLLSRVMKAKGKYSGHLERMLKRYLVCPIGFTDLEEYIYAYCYKPSVNTELGGIYKKIESIPFIYDKTCVDKNLRIIDLRYTDCIPLYNSPKEIDSEHLYRGISEAEFNFILKRGFIKSNRSKNVEQNPKVTYFAQNLQTAMFYAISLISLFREGPTFINKTYVLKIARKGLDYFINDRDKAGVWGRISVSNVVDVWELRLLAAGNFGQFSMIVNPDGEISKWGHRVHIQPMIGMKKITLQS